MQDTESLAYAALSSYIASNFGFGVALASGFDAMSSFCFGAMPVFGFGAMPVFKVVSMMSVVQAVDVGITHTDGWVLIPIPGITVSAYATR
ncbi:MAG: hypothetical protein V7731_22830 [Amphritea sp.]